MSAERLRAAVSLTCQELDASERRVCRALWIHRSPVCCNRKRADGEVALRKEILRLSNRHRRYGYRRILVLLRRDDWKVNHKRVERLRGEMGLQVPWRRRKASSFATARRLLRSVATDPSQSGVEL